jgi:hypothetical protein
MISSQGKRNNSGGSFSSPQLVSDRTKMSNIVQPTTIASGRQQQENQ